MLARFNRMTAAVLSGVTASLLVAASATAAQDKPFVVYGEPNLYNVIHVPYGDLNLSASTDRKVLKSRVGAAVRDVCDFDAVGIVVSYRACATSAWNEARPQIDRAISRAEQLSQSGQSSVAAGAMTISIRSR